VLVVLRPHTITVAINGGAVTLLRTLRSERERKMVAPWAEPGVTDVVNDLVVAS
jgi:osmotically-inducible protein OsmY